MKMRTRLTSYFMAGVMALSTILSTGITSFAAGGYQNSSIDSTYKKVRFGEEGGIMMAVYLAGEGDGYFGDGDGTGHNPSNSEVISILNKTCDPSKQNPALFSYRDDAVYFVLDKNKSEIGSSARMTTVSTSSGCTYGYEYVSDSEGYDSEASFDDSYESGGENTSRNKYVFADEIDSFGDWGWILGKTHTKGQAVPTNIKDAESLGGIIYDNMRYYRESTTYSAEKEWEKLIEPLTQRCGSSMKRALESANNNGKPITLMFELYASCKDTYSDGSTTPSRLYISVHNYEDLTKALTYASAAYANANTDKMVRPEAFDWSTPSKIQESVGTWTSVLDLETHPSYVAYDTYYRIYGSAYPYGTPIEAYWNVIDRMRKCMTMVYCSSYMLNPTRARNTSLFKDQLAINHPIGGLSYYSLMNNPESNKTISINVSKTVDVQGLEGYKALENQFKHTSLPGFKFYRTAAFTAESLGFKSGEIEKVANSIVDKYKSPVHFWNDGHEGKSVNLSVTNSTVKWTVNINNQLKKGAVYFVVYERNDKYELASGFKTEWAAVGSTLIEISLVKDKVQVKSVDLGSLWNAKDGKDRVSTIVAATTKGNKTDIGVSIVNKVKVTPPDIDEGPNLVEVDIELPDVTIEDIDNYYLKNYLGDADATRLIYTHSRLATDVVENIKGYIPAWSWIDESETLAKNEDLILDGLNSEDITTLAVLPEQESNTEGTTFSKTATYDWNIGLINPNGKSFTVKDDYIKRYQWSEDSGITYGFMNLELAKSAAAKGNTNYFVSTVDKIKLLNQDKSFGASELPTVGTTYTLDTTSKNGISAADMKTSMDAYIEYAKKYALYEGMIATSAGDLNVALTFWSRAAQTLYAEAYQKLKDWESGSGENGEFNLEQMVDKSTGKPISKEKIAELTAAAEAELAQLKADIETLTDEKITKQAEADSIIGTYQYSWNIPKREDRIKYNTLCREIQDISAEIATKEARVSQLERNLLSRVSNDNYCTMWEYYMYNHALPSCSSDKSGGDKDCDYTLDTLPLGPDDTGWSVLNCTHSSYYEYSHYNSGSGYCTNAFGWHQGTPKITDTDRSYKESWSYKHSGAYMKSQVSGALSKINSAVEKEAKTVLDDIDDALEKITGWTITYYIAVPTYELVKTGTDVCTTRESWTSRRDWTTEFKADVYSLACKIEYMSSRGGSKLSSEPDNLIKIDTSGAPYKVANLPEGIAVILEEEDLTEATSIGGYIGDLVERANKMLNEISTLENNRPHAEIHITSTYTATLPDDLYKKAEVPEYMVSMWWKNPAVFTKDNKFLTAVLDFDPNSIASDLFVVSTSKEIDTNVENGSTRLLNRLKDKANMKSGESSWAYYFIQKLNSTASDVVYLPQYTYMYAAKPDEAIVDAESVLNRHLANFQTINILYPESSKAETNKRFVYTADKYTITKDKSLRISDLDVLGYLKGSFKTFTTIWAIADGNPTKTVLPTTEWIAKLPAGVQKQIMDSKTAMTLGALNAPVSANTTSSGAVTAEGTGFLEFIPSGSKILENSTTSLIHKYTGTNISDTSKVYFFSTSGIAPGLPSNNRYVAGSEATDNISANGGLNVNVSTTPYITKASFKHKNSGTVETPDPLEPMSTLDPDDPDFWDNHESAYGRYTRQVAGGTFNIYPLVKRAYYTSAGTIGYTYTVGSEARAINANVYYQIGLVGNATPSIVTNAPASSSQAMMLGTRYGASNVSYSGAGITITYNPDVSMYFQTYALEDMDLLESYQNEWGNDAWKNATSAHEEWLESIGGTKKNVDTGSGTEIGIWTIPYIAGCETAVKEDAGREWVTGNWVLDQDGAKLALADNSDPYTQTSYVKLYIEGGVLVGVQVTQSYKNSKGDIIQAGCYTINGFAGDDASVCTMFDANGNHKAGTWTTAALLNTLKRNDLTRDIYKALVNVGITGDENCLLKKSFENNTGATVSGDYNKKLAKGLRVESDKSYNEYAYCLALRVETTKFRLQPLVFTDKLPAEYGPATPADKAYYFSDGYGFQASALLLKLGVETDSSEMTGVSNPLADMASVIGTTWRINRADTDGAQSNTVDLVIGNVDVTAAN